MLYHYHLEWEEVKKNPEGKCPAASNWGPQLGAGGTPEFVTVVMILSPFINPEISQNEQHFG